MSAGLPVDTRKVSEFRIPVSLSVYYRVAVAKIIINISETAVHTIVSCGSVTEVEATLLTFEKF